ncbi:MAG: hypothetical protein R3D65_18480 [Zhengella sp.]|uniref:hypothetical protein n=1 Tax=Zhengella sp. TaxID=2282762 RepID=UPI001E0E8A71|nr:hypothetical protein [Notoacmeibacter sp.]MCC0028338.1 hypothetical protein [Brucellaceae bacterium]
MLSLSGGRVRFTGHRSIKAKIDSFSKHRKTTMRETGREPMYGFHIAFMTRGTVAAPASAMHAPRLTKTMAKKTTATTV